MEMAPVRGPFPCWKRWNRNHRSLGARSGGRARTACAGRRRPLDSVRPGGGAGAPEEGIPSGMGGARTRSDAPEPRTACAGRRRPLDSVRPGGGAGAPEEGIPSGMGGARTRFDAPEPRTAWRQEGSGLSTRAARREAPLPRGVR